MLVALITGGMLSVSACYCRNKVKPVEPVEVVHHEHHKVEKMKHEHVHK